MCEENGKKCCDKECNCNQIKIKQEGVEGPYLISERSSMVFDVDKIQVVRCSVCDWSTVVFHTAAGTSFSLPMGLDFEVGKSGPNTSKEFQCQTCSRKKSSSLGAILLS